MVPELAATTTEPVSTLDFAFHSVSGGCIHESWCVESRYGRWFLKTNTADKASMFGAEFAGLKALEEVGCIRVPRPIATGVTMDTAWLVMEFIPLRAGTDPEYLEMGRRLARLHRSVSPDLQHGWTQDNFIGATPQKNAPHSKWSHFFRDKRLAPQLDLHLSDFPNSVATLDAVEILLAGHTPEPSALHGDLWSGNAEFDENGAPVLFDPAFYYGDRETDLAFTRMFGGFSAGFYRGYRSEYPLLPGHETRSDLYNLYHLLNHHHLFGEPYGHQARLVMTTLLRQADSLSS